MIKKFLLLLICFSLLSGVTYAASSDVLEERDRALITEIRLMNEQLLHEMQEMRTELKAEIQKVDKKVDEVQKGLKSEIQNAKTELKTELQCIKTELKAEIQKVDKKIDEVQKGLKSEIQSVKTELKTEIKKVGADVKVVDAKLHGMESTFYLGLGFLVLLIALSIFRRVLNEFVKGFHNSKFTVKDIENIVKNVIKANRFELQGK